MFRFIVIGISDNPQPFFTPDVLEIIRNGHYFSGGKRHHDIVAPFLPADSEWIEISAPLDAVFSRYSVLGGLPAESVVIIFASGDPLFFGFANTLRQRMPQAHIQVFPTFNSLQMLSHRLLMPYHDMRIVSLTGRPWQEFDRALIEGSQKLGVLTDKTHTPTAIARRMLDYGFCHYLMHIGEHLGHPSLERITTLSLDEATRHSFSFPNCVILCGKAAEHVSSPLPVRGGFPASSFGLPDAAFSLLDGREKMITKMPIRLLTLQALDLPRRHTFWDIGFCTGSVSIEARRLFPHLTIHAFEIRPECEALIHENARRFHAPGINIHIGDFLATDLSLLPPPDAVFIGGHGGHLKEIISRVLTVLAPDGVIVFNSVTSPIVNQLTDRPASRSLWNEACHAFRLTQSPPLRVQIDEHNPIEILRATYHPSN